MKIKNVTEPKTRLLKLKLLKTKVYKKKNHFKIEDVECRLKKALHVIYRYHVSNKRILFIGTPLYTHQKLKPIVKTTKHIFIPESIWMGGIITNQLACFKFLSENQNTTNKKVSELLFQLKKKSDLIVILNKSSNLTALEEGYTARIPIISLNSNLDILDTKPTYKIPGNFNFTKKKIRDNFFYSVLTAIFRKAGKDKDLIQKSELRKHKHSLSNLSYVEKSYQNKTSIKSKKTYSYKKK